MRTFIRLSLIPMVGLAAQAAHAAINYDVLQATISYNNGDTYNLVAKHPTPLSIQFGGGAVGQFEPAGHDAAVITIIYTVTSTQALDQLKFNVIGGAFNLGQVDYSEIVEKWSPDSGSGSILASYSGNFKGSGFAGGSDDSFNNFVTLNFTEPVFSYKVKKTFTLLDFDPVHLTSGAGITQINQTSVPEPASMTALAIGGLALLAKRRKK